MSGIEQDAGSVVAGLSNAPPSLGDASDVHREIATLKEAISHTTEPGVLADLHLQIGLLYLDGLHDSRSAIAAFQSAHRQLPGHAPPLRVSFDLFCETRQWEMAVRILESELKGEVPPWSRVRLLTLRGDLLRWHLRAPARAAESYTEALALSPGHHPAARALVEMGPSLSKPTEALSTLEASVESLPPEEGTTRRLQSARLRLALDPEDAEADAALSEVLTATPEHLEALSLLERSRWRRGEVEGALSLGRRRLELELREGATHSGGVGAEGARALGLVQLFERAVGAGQPAEEVISLLKAAVDADPVSVLGWARLGAHCEGLGRWSEAIEALDQLAALSISPQFRAAHLTHQAYLLARHVEQGEGGALGPRAVEALETVVVEHAAWGTARKALERHHRARGDWAGVAQLIRAGLPHISDPDRQVSRLCEMAAIEALRLGDPDGALEACEIALERRQGHPLALAMRLCLEAKAGSWARVLQTESMAPRTADHLRALMRQWLAGAPEVATLRWQALLAERPDDLLAWLHLDPLITQGANPLGWVQGAAGTAEAVEDPWIVGALITSVVDRVTHDLAGDAEAVALAWGVTSRAAEMYPWSPDVIEAALRLPASDVALGAIADGLLQWLSDEARDEGLVPELWVALDELHARLGRPVPPAATLPRRLAPEALPALQRYVWGVAAEGRAPGRLCEGLEMLARCTDEPQARLACLMPAAVIRLERLGELEAAGEIIERMSALAPEHPLVQRLADQACARGATVPQGADQWMMQALGGQATDCALAAMRAGEHERALGLLEAIEARGGAPCPLEVERLYRLLRRHRDLESLLGEWLSEGAEDEVGVRWSRALLRGTSLRAPGGALEDLQIILKRQPDHAQARHWALALVGRVGDLEAVETLLATTEEDNPLRVSLLARLGGLLEGQSRWEEALKAWAALLERHPDDLRGVQALRRLYTRLGRGDDALQMVEREGRLLSDPKEGGALLLAAARVREKRLDDVDGAAALLEAGLERDPTSEALLDAARQMYGRYGRWEALAELLERLSSLDPDQRWTHLLEAGRLYVRRLSNPERAIKTLGAALAKADEHAPAFLQELADLYVEQGAWTEAATVYERLRRASPDEEMRQAVTFRLAALYEDKLNDIDRAASCLDDLLVEDEVHPEALLRRSRIAEGRGDRAYAISLLRRATPRVTSPSRVMLLQTKLGTLAEAAGDFEGALDAYALALAAAPDDLELLELVVGLVDKSSQPQRIFELVEAGRRARGEGQEGKASARWIALRRDLVRRALNAKKAPERALSEARAMAQAGEGGAEAQMLYAHALSTQSDSVEKAASQYLAALDADPLQPEALRGLMRSSERMREGPRAYQIALLLNGLGCGGAEEQAVIGRWQRKIKRIPAGQLSNPAEHALLDPEEAPSFNMLLIELIECLPDLLPPIGERGLATLMESGPLAELGELAARALHGELSVMVIPGSTSRRVSYVDGRPSEVIFPEESLRGMGRGERLFHMGRALHLGHRGLTRWIRLHKDNIRRVLAVALGVDGDWSPLPRAGGTLAQHARQLSEGLDEVGRRRLSTVATQIRALGAAPDVTPALLAVKRSSDRAGLLVAGSILPAISVLTREAGVRVPGGATSEEIIGTLRTIPRLAPLVRWSLQARFYTLRARLGFE